MAIMLFDEKTCMEQFLKSTKDGFNSLFADAITEMCIKTDATRKRFLFLTVWGDSYSTEVTDSSFRDMAKFVYDTLSYEMEDG